MDIGWSSNPPYDSKNPGCVQFTIFDDQENELEGGELDYPSDDVLLYDMIPGCLEIMGDCLGIKDILNKDIIEVPVND